MSTPSTKACPGWAAKQIDQIATLEVRLGNIRPEGDFKEAMLADVVDRIGSDEAAFDESAVEALFVQVSRGLAGEGFTPDEIAGVINARIPSGKLPYCNASEVREALLHA
jgi:hypothetical protein